MFTPSSHAIGAYTRIGVETGVANADSHMLVLMLYDGLLAAIADAKRLMQQNDIPGKGRAISKAIAILEDGLMASLDMNAGGSISVNLAALYQYACTQLLAANLHDRTQALDEVSELIGELQSGWKQIRPQVITHPQPAAGPAPAQGVLQKA